MNVFRRRRPALGAAMITILAGCSLSKPTSMTPLESGSASGPTTMERALPSTTERIDAVPTQTERSQVLGYSVSGLPIELLTFGNGAERILIFGGIHGDERNASELAEALVDYLRGSGPVPANRTVAVLPRANPDGLARKTRGNANGVDLNRNFPASNWRRAPRSNRHGKAAASEPETQAIMAAVEQLRPSLILSIHANHGGRECNNYDGPARAVAERMAALNGYPAVASIGYPTPGSFGSWAGIDRGIPTITLELPRRASGSEAWARQKAALLDVVGLGDAAGEQRRGSDVLTPCGQVHGDSLRRDGRGPISHALCGGRWPGSGKP